MPKDLPSFETRPRMQAVDSLQVISHIGRNTLTAEGERAPLLKDLLAYTLEKRLQVIEHILCAL